MKTFFQRVGATRLIKLAKILDKADALHAKLGEPAYDQGAVIHPCGTPACALGHWAFHNPRRWCLDVFNGATLKVTGHSNTIPNGMGEFGIDEDESRALFGYTADPNTAKEAATLIRAFVKRKLAEAGI